MVSNHPPIGEGFISPLRPYKGLPRPCARITACSWQDKKKVNFFFIKYQPNGQGTVQSKKRDCTLSDVNGPPCVSAYNKFMGGVHYADQKRGDYKFPIKSHRLYHSLAVFFIETAALNAFILRQLSPNHAQKAQLKFRHDTVQEE